MEPNRKLWYLRIPAKEILSREDFLLLSLEAKGLLCHCILSAACNGSLPSAPSELARVVGASTDQVESLLPSIARFFYPRGGRLVCPMVEAERRRATDISKKNSRTMQREWEKRRRRQQDASGRTANAKRTQCYSESVSESSTDPDSGGASLRSVSESVAHHAAGAPRTGTETVSRRRDAREQDEDFVPTMLHLLERKKECIDNTVSEVTRELGIEPRTPDHATVIYWVDRCGNKAAMDGLMVLRDETSKLFEGTREKPIGSQLAYWIEILKRSTRKGEIESQR
jgi:uncharacterized protein YdaU (DUF1376 family)